MKGLCHSCLTSDVELVDDRGQVICVVCFGNRYKMKSPENEEISLDKLKEIWKKQRRYE